MFRVPSSWTAQQRLDHYSIPEPTSGCVLWLGGVLNHGHGYLRFQGRKVLAHRLAWSGAHGAIPQGLEICHSCDVPSCINPQHLFCGTHKDNMDDRDRKGRVAYGARLPQTQLSDADVIAISQTSGRQKDVAAEYGIDRAMVSLIRARKTRKHLFHSIGG